MRGPLFALFCALAPMALTPMALAPMARAQEAAPVIAAAADLQFVVTEIAANFTEDTGMQVQLTFGSTGNFARQIREGAPFQMFMAADESFVTDLHKDGFTKDDGALYGIGRIVMMVPKGAPLAADGSLASLKAALDAGTLQHFAIANPDHAPYGKRAKEALQSQGLWDRLQPYLVLGENVSQAAQFALSGDAQGGIIAYSLALAPEIAPLGDYDLIPADWHDPLRQRMVLLNGAGTVAQAFYSYLQQPKARAILDRFGFALPEGS